MIILLSPSKTQNQAFKKREIDHESPLFFQRETNDLVKRIKKMNKEELAKVMKIKGDLLDRTFKAYKGFDKQEVSPTIFSYNGAVYQNAGIFQWTEDDLKWSNQHVLILSALYGVTKPLEMIANHRLDMKMKIDTIGSLYDYWGDKIDDYIKKKDTTPLIINLASKEYSRMVHMSMTHISFKSNKEGVYKTIGTYSKMARGMFLNYMVQNRCLIDQFERSNDNQALYNLLTKFKKNGYEYNEELSDFNNIVFTKS